MKTIVVNAFGGPGAGKTTAAWEICSELKKAGILAEYVSEYAKELVYEMNSPYKGESDRAKQLLNGTMDSQSVLFAEQKHRVDRLMGQVAVIVTDSPILLSAIYANDATQEFTDNIVRQFCDYTSFNFIVKRDDVSFEQEGRIHNMEQSKQKDNEIKSLLDNFGIPYEEYTHQTIPKLVWRLTELTRAFARTNTDKDLTMLEDDLSGVMIRKENADMLSKSLSDKAEELNEEIDELKSERDL